MEHALERRRSFDPPLVVGIISDTHIYAQGMRRIPEPVFELFRRAKVGLIVHLGDVNVPVVLDELGDIAPVIAVYGNNDSDELLDTLPEKVRFRIGRHTFGAVHGFGGRSARDVVTRAFAGKVDVALFGHSHIPFMETVKGTVLFNPGSATDRRWHQHFGVGIITVTDEQVRPELVLYADPAHLGSIRFDADGTQESEHP